MKKANTALISVTGSAVSLLLLLLPAVRPLAAAEAPAQRVAKIFLEIDGVHDPSPRDPYRLLLGIREGEEYDRQKIRVSISNLYRTDDFSDIEVKMGENGDGSVNLHFLLFRKKLVRFLRFPSLPGLERKSLRAAVSAVKRYTVFEESQLKKAIAEVREFLIDRGYSLPRVECRAVPLPGGNWLDLQFAIQPGAKAKIRHFAVVVDDPLMKRAIAPLFRGSAFYVPADIRRLEQKTLQLLQKHNFFFPEVAIDTSKADSAANLMDVTVRITCGYKYNFRFVGLPEKMDLIRSVWEKKVFEKWAEEESRARILSYLNNAGYIHAQVQSEIIAKGNEKNVIFSVVRDRRYRLGDVIFEGDLQVPEAKLREIIQIDDLLFERLLWLRGASLLADREVLRLYYYYQGFADAKISVEPRLHKNTADILFRISANRRYVTAAIQFSGNRSYSAAELLTQMKTQPGGPFVQQQVNEDIYRLQNFYWNNGFTDATVGFEISQGVTPALSIQIAEGGRQRLGNFIIVGGSNVQRSLIRRLFPLKSGDFLAKDKLDSFRAELENSMLFAEARVESLRSSPEVTDVFVKVIPDRGRSYGFGLGWVERKELGLRGTLEYQEKNVFNSTSTLSAMVQLTLTRFFKVDPLERRGVLAVDSPFFLKSKVHSTFNVWEENEIFPSYRFKRWGFGASFIKYFSDTTYAIGSLKWYRTSLTELMIPAFGVDRLGVPFNTTAVTFSLAREKRDDPFNPTSGHFVSADLKIGLPIFEKDYTFFKFFWNYQWHAPVLKNGVFSLSFRNGFGFGDMSITERFFAGGSHSFRGTRNDRLGPLYIDPSDGEEWPRGGNILVLLNMELTFPVLLAPVKELYYSVFADVGNVFATSSQLDFGKMEKAIGIGLKYRTPMGPIRLGLAYNLRASFEPHFLFHLGIGNVY